MVDKHLSDRQLDDAIDRAVRDLMSAEPRTDLRARVLAELEGASSRLALWPRLAVGGAALALAAVLVAMLVFRPTPQPDDARIAGRTPPPSAPAAATPPPSPPTFGDRPNRVLRGPEHVPVPPPVDVQRERQSPSDRLVQAASLDTLDAAASSSGVATPAIEPLAPLASIRVSNLAAIGTATPDIVLKPITVGAIEIAPLTPQR